MVEFLIRVLGKVLRACSPEIKQLLTNAIKSVYAKALATENPLDDLLVEFVAVILDIELT